MKKLIALSCLLAVSLLALAQGERQGKFNPAEFKEKLERFITKEAAFTSSEATAFYPIYHEMKGKQRQLQRKIFQLKKDAKDSSAESHDFATTIQKIKQLNTEIAQLEESYYKKMCQAVAARKVYQAMCAEDRFHRKMLQEFGHKHRHDKKAEKK